MSGDAYWRGHKPANQRFVVENAVPVDAIAAVPSARPDDLGIPAGHPIVISVGRLDEQKNTAVLVRALVRLAAETPALGVICGEGPLRASLEALIAQSEASDRIRLPGFMPNVWPAREAAQVFVSLSAFEGRPNAVLEAMAARCPLVVSDIPEHREILDENSALLVRDYHNPAAVAAVIAATPADPTKKAARSEKAFARASEARIDRVAEAYQQVYATIPARRRK